MKGKFRRTTEYLDQMREAIDRIDAYMRVRRRRFVVSLGICRNLCRWVMLALVVLIEGCQGTQLSITTIDVASTIEAIQEKQIINNFGRIVAQKYQMPSQVTLTSGTVQIVNTVTPGINFPLSSMFARTVSANPSSVSTTAGSGMQIGASVSWQENFIIQPIADPMTLRNLNILYNLALDVTGNKSDLELYQMPGTYDKPVSDKLRSFIPDQNYVHMPTCVFCLSPGHDEQGFTVPASGVELEQMAASGKITINAALTNQWLYYRATTESPDLYHPAPPAAGATMHYIGSDNGYSFYVVDHVYNDGGHKVDGYKLFSDFVLLTLPPGRSQGPSPSPGIQPGSRAAQ